MNQAELEFVARFTDQVTREARQAQRVMESLGGPVEAITQAVNVDTKDLDAATKDAARFAKVGQESATDFERAMKGLDVGQAETVLKSLGLDAEKMGRQLEAGGQEAEAATRDLARALGQVEDPAKRAAAASLIFGRDIDGLDRAVQGLSLDAASRDVKQLESNFREISPAVDNAADKLDRSVDQMVSDVRRLEREASDAGEQVGAGMGDGMGRGISGKKAALLGVMGGVIGAVAVEGLAKIGEFVTGSVSKFSDLEDAIGATSVTFGENMSEITAAADGAAATLGMSKAQFIAASQQFGTFGKAAGLAGGDLSGFSIQMANLAGDMSSFKGGSVEDAIAAVGSALRGEFEPIRAYGVLLDDATLKSEALAMGLITTTKDALTPQQKTLAAQSAILKQSSDAMGDFARTSDSAANSQKTFKATLENVQASLGGAISPAVTAILQSLTGVMPAVEKVLTALGTGIGGALEALAPLLTTMLDGVTPIIETLGGTIKTLFETIGPPLQTAMGAIMETLGPVLSSVITMLGGALGTLLPPLLDIVTTVVTGLKPVFDALMPVVEKLAGSLAGVLGTALVSIGEAIGIILPPLADLAVQVLGALMPAFDAIMPVVADVAKMLGGVLADAVKQLAPIIERLTPVIVELAELFAGQLSSQAEMWGEIMKTLGPIIGEIVTAVVTLINDALDIMMPIFEEMMPIIRDVAKQFGEGLMQALKMLLPIILQLVQQALPIILQLMESMWPVVQQLWQAFAQILPALMPLIPVILELVQALIPLLPMTLDLVMTILPPLIELFTTLLTPILALIDPIMALLVPAIELISSNLETVIGWITSAINWFVDLRTKGEELAKNLGKVWNEIWEGIKTKFDDAKNFVSEIPGKMAAFFSGLWSKIVGFFSEIKTGIETKFNEAVTWVGEIPTKITNAVGAVGALLYEKGKNIVEGLWNGIKDMGSWLWNKVSSFISDKIPGPVKWALGIASPSKLMRKFGRWTMQGLALGIEGEGAAVAASAVAAAQSIAGAFNDNLALSTDLSPVTAPQFSAPPSPSSNPVTVVVEHRVDFAQPEVARKLSAREVADMIVKDPRATTALARGLGTQVSIEATRRVGS